MKKFSELAEKVIPHLIIPFIIILFGLYIWFDFTHPEEMTMKEKEEFYSDRGPQGGNNRFGR